MTPPEILRTGHGVAGEPGWRVRVFPNLYPITEAHEVVVLSPDHDRTFADLSDDAAAEVLHGAARPRAGAPRCRAPVRHRDHQPGPRRGRVDRAPARTGLRARLRPARRRGGDRPATGDARRPARRRHRRRARPRASSCTTARSRCGARSRRRRRSSCACATPKPIPPSTTRPTTRSPPLPSPRATPSPPSAGRRPRAVQRGRAHGTTLVRRDHAAARPARGIRTGDRCLREHDPARACGRVSRGEPRVSVTVTVCTTIDAPPDDRVGRGREHRVPHRRG